MTSDTLRRIFTRKGWEVLSATTVAGGVALLDPPPDCILLDLMLPDGDGEEILRRVREGNLKTRVAVCTGMAQCARLETVKKLAPEALLRKPINVLDVCHVCQMGPTD